MSNDQRTKDFVNRQRATGRSTNEILRIHKRSIAREVFRYLTTPVAIPTIDDLPPPRHTNNLTPTTAAQHFGVCPADISRLERRLTPNDQLADAYHQCLQAA
jgi:transposase